MMTGLELKRWMNGIGLHNAKALAEAFQVSPTTVKNALDAEDASISREMEVTVHLAQACMMCDSAHWPIERDLRPEAEAAIGAIEQWRSSSKKAKRVRDQAREDLLTAAAQARLAPLAPRRIMESALQAAENGMENEDDTELLRAIWLYRAA